MNDTARRVKPPPSPESVPPTLTRATPTFRMHVWTSSLALVAFVAVYIGLTLWLAAMIFRFVRDGLHGNLFIGILESLAPALLLFVLVRGLFAIKRGTDAETLVEVTAEQEPALVAFIHDIADQAGAPRPHKIFLSPEVNAGVFYDLGFVNFLFPTKKNLRVGLGLLNVLTLSELRAVLAHEFGHFAQKSMAVGRWVYLAEQIAAHIVASRSRLDRWLQTLSVQDPRIAWIGWALRLCVWAVRAVLDTMYLLVALSKRALSREMELQADLVAVSLTGSDALVHALHKAHAADQGFTAAVTMLQKELAAKVRVVDVYALQTRHIENVRRVSVDPTFGAAPALPETGRAEHRVFEKRFAQPSKMWSTHPPDREREDNIKRVYVACALDDRSSWELFVDSARTRRQLTDRIISALLAPPVAQQQQQEGAAPAPKVEPPQSELDPAEAMALVDATFNRPFHRPEYRGVFLGRYLTRHTASSGMLFDPEGYEPWTEPSAPSSDALYPEAMRDDIERWRQLWLEVAMLEGLRDGHLRASDATMSYRGEPVARWQLPLLVERARAEKAAAEQLVAARDRALRTVHQRMARKLGRGWAAYHESLVRLVHYAEHTAADIADANGYLTNVFQIVMADGHVSQSEFHRLLSASQVAYESLARAYWQKDQIVLPGAVLDRLNRATSRHEAAYVSSFAARLGELQLGAPSDFNLGQWLPHAQSWLSTVPFDFEALADAAVDELLEVEAQLREAIAGGDSAIAAREDAPAPAQFPAQYVTLEPGRERERQRTLGWWDRFQLADGVAPGVARAAVASAMIGGMAVLGHLAVSHPVYVYNGLSRPVSVTIGTTTVTIPGGGHSKLSIGRGDGLRVRTVTESGQLVEEFDADVSNGQSTYVYNVARAGLLYNITYTFDVDRAYSEVRNSGAAPRFLGNPRWMTDSSPYRFRVPERSVALIRGERSTTHVLLQAVPLDADPLTVLRSAPSDEACAALARAHVRFDPPDARLFRWAEGGALVAPDLGEILARRVADAGPAALDLMLAEYDYATPVARDAVCARHRQWAASHAGAAGDVVVARCITDRAERERALRASYARHVGDPARPYLAYGLASIEVERGAFDRAAPLCDEAMSSSTLAERAGVLAARVARVRWALAQLDRGEAPPRDFASAPLGRAAGLSAVVRRNLDVESGVGGLDEDPAYALAQGRPRLAVDRAGGGSSRQYFTILAAASDGANPTDATDVLASESPVDGLVAYWLAALAIREGQMISSGVEAAALTHDPRFNEMVAWLGRQRAAGSGTVGEIPAEFHQPSAMAMAIIVLGSATPVRWRTIARAYYFAIERPYFTPNPQPTEGIEGLGRGGLPLGGLGVSDAVGAETFGAESIGDVGSARERRSARP